MKSTTIQKWGNSYAVRIPASAVRKLKLRAGQAVRVEETQSNGLSITPVTNKEASLADLINRITLENRYGEIDWGVPVGKEAW